MIMGLLVTVVTILVTGVLLWVARRLIPGDTKQDHHDVIIAVHQMVGMLYAILLAFVVIIVWETASKADDDSQVEANKVSQIYFTARDLPEPQRGQLTGLAKQYATTVVDEEWPLMAQGETSAKARALVGKMRTTAHDLRPASAHDEILMDQTLTAINELVEARRARTDAVESKIPPIMWAGLIVGAALTVGITFVYDYTRYVPHFLMVSAMTLLTVFLLWLTWEMSQPFDGPTGVGPDAFATIRDRFAEFP
ncbi:MAG: DUF4239 domain-containing protein [Micromonosporaceae bacterium]